MSNTHNPTTVSKEMPIIRGSTRDILIELYKRAMDIKDVSSDDLVLGRCVALDAKTTQAKNKISLAGLDLATRTVSIIDERIDKMPKTSKLIGDFKQKNNQFREELAKNTKRSEELSQQFHHFVHEQREKISEFFINKPNRTATDILRLLDELEKELKNYTSAVKISGRDIKFLQDNLAVLKNQVTATLPPETQIAIQRAEEAAVKPAAPVAFKTATEPAAEKPEAKKLD